MNDKANSAAFVELESGSHEIAAIILQSLVSKAEREGSPIEPVDFIGAAAALLESAWHLAKMAGPEHREGYAQIIQSHAEAIRSLP